MDETKHSANLALAAYAENFLAGRRVVVFGDASSGFAELLVERGARLVHVYDADASRVARAIAVGGAPNVSFAPLTPAGLPVRDGAFDVGFVTNLASHAQPNELVNRLRRALSARGIGFLAVPNTEQSPVFDPQPEAQGLSYYELYDLACSEFDEVRTLGQTPFVGYALADFGPDRDETFTIDTALVPGGAEEPEWFIAVVSHFPINCEPFSVIQFPAAQLLDQAHEPVPTQVASPPPEPAPDRSRELLVQARLELDKRDAWVSELEIKRAEAEAAAASARAKAEAAAASARAEAETAAASARAESQQLQSSLAEAAEQARSARNETVRVQNELAAVKQQLTEARNQLRAATDRERALSENQAETAKLLALAEQRQSRVEALETALAEARAANATLVRATEEQSSENQGFEELLRERAHVVQQLERDLRKADLFGAQLLRELEDARDQESAPPGAPANDSAAASEPEVPGQRELELEAQVAKLAAVDAQRVADLTAAQWTIGELETRLLESGASTSLAEELRLAQTQLQRQATLLAQLQASTHDLDA